MKKVNQEKIVKAHLKNTASISEKKQSVIKPRSSSGASRSRSCSFEHEPSSFAWLGLVKKAL